MNHEVISIVRKAGIEGLPKSSSASGDSYGLTEHDLVDLVTSHALCEHSGLSGAQAFARKFTEATPEGAALRKAHAIVQRGQFAEVEDDDSDREDAIHQLQEIGKRKWPSLKPPQQFSRALETEIALAKRACRPPTARTSFAFPR